MEAVILGCYCQEWREEVEFARAYFEVHDSRMTIPRNSVVIPRYSVLPFYQ